MDWIGGQIAVLHGEDFPAAALALLSLLLLAVLAWATLVALLASSPALHGLAIALTPRMVRGMVFAGVAGALAVPAAHAEDGSVDGLRLPDRPLVADTSEPARHGPAAQGSQTVVVGPGDTLWAIARAHLAPGSDNAAIAKATASWHRTNRQVIGRDADLIHPGQRLATPSKDRS